MTDRMRLPSRSTSLRPTVLCIALAAALQAGSAWAVEPFVLKDIRVEGLQRSEKGARVVFTREQRTVIDGPFAETKELVAGFWLFQCKSLEECVAWVKQCPNPTGDHSVIEIRQVFEAEDFGDFAGDALRGEAEAAINMIANLN